MKRAEHFQTLIEVTQTATLTPGMTEALGDFCHQVVAAEAEAPEIKAAAGRALQVLQSRLEANRKVAAESAATADIKPESPAARSAKSL